MIIHSTVIKRFVCSFQRKVAPDIVAVFLLAPLSVMDSSDDPDITPYHLQFRAQSAEKGKKSEKEEDGKQDGSYSWKNLFIRIALACLFMGVGIGVLIWSFSRPEETHQNTNAFPPAPQTLHLSHSSACKYGGTVNITLPQTNFSNSMLLPSKWLHNRRYEQLKITFGNRSDTTGGQWLFDLYFLQYAVYALIPDPWKTPSYSCMVDRRANYSSEIKRLESSHLVPDNTSTTLNLYRGRFEQNDKNEDTLQIWTDYAGMPHGVIVRRPYATFNLWYGDCMQDTVPDLDEDIKAVTNGVCQEGRLDDNFVKEHLDKLSGSL